VRSTTVFKLDNKVLWGRLYNGGGGGGVGDRTTAVVFRHLASFSELPQRKEVRAEERVRDGGRAREEGVVGEGVKERGKKPGHLCTVHTVTDRLLL